MSANAEATVTLSLVDRITGPIRRITARLSGLSKRIGLEKVGASITNLGNRFRGLGDGIARTSGRLAGLFGLLGAGSVGAIAGAWNLAKGASDVGSEIHDMAAKLGMSTEALSEWHHVADQAGVEAETFDTAITKMGINASLASKGNKELGKAFKSLGVHLKDAHGKMRSTDDILDDTILSLTKIKDPLQRNAAAFKIFGKSGAEFGKILTDGAASIKATREEARRLGIVWSQDAANAADRLGDASNALTKRLKAFGTFVGAQLMPVFSDLVEGINSWFDANSQLIKSKIVEWTGRLAGVVRDLFDPTSSIRQQFAKLGETISGLIGVIKPVVDFLGGPLNAALLLIGFWALAPAISAVTLLSGAFLKLGLSIASVAVSTISAMSGAVADLAGAGLGKALESAGAASGALWGKAFSVAAKLAIIAGIASIVADVLEKYDPKGNLGGFTKPVDDFLRNKLGLPEKDTGITPGEIWKGLFGSSDDKKDDKGSDGKPAPNKSSWSSQPEALSPVARDLGFDQSNFFGFQPIRTGSTDTLPGKTKDDAISQDVITSNSGNTTVTISAPISISNTQASSPQDLGNAIAAHLGTLSRQATADRTSSLSD